MQKQLDEMSEKSTLQKSKLNNPKVEFPLDFNVGHFDTVSNLWESLNNLTSSKVALLNRSRIKESRSPEDIRGGYPLVFLDDELILLKHLANVLSATHDEMYELASRDLLAKKDRSQ